MKYLLDTNVVIDFLEAAIPAKGMLFLKDIADGEPAISVITKMETLGFNFPSEQEQKAVEAFINGSTLFDINDDIVAQTIALRKNYKTKLPDAIIAATARVYELTLITHNTSDFKNITNLKIIDPHSF